jgi:hypothetical protein
MVLKHRYGWGWETLIREVSDSLQLPFLLDPAPGGAAGRVDGQEADPTVGPETLFELSRVVIGKAQRETRFRARAVRIDSTLVEANVRSPTDYGLAADGVRVLAREGKRLAAKLGGTDAKKKAKARGQAARMLASVERLETLAEHSEQVVEQIGKRLTGEPIKDRLVSLFDPDAAAPRPLPGRRRGPDLAPQTPARAPAEPTEKRRGRAHPDGLGGARLQRRDPRTLRPSRAAGDQQKPKGEAQTTATSPTQQTTPHQRLSGSSSARRGFDEHDVVSTGCPISDPYSPTPILR